MLETFVSVHRLRNYIGLLCVWFHNCTTVTEPIDDLDNVQGRSSTKLPCNVTSGSQQSILFLPLDQVSLEPNLNLSIDEKFEISWTKSPQVSWCKISAFLWCCGPLEAFFHSVKRTGVIYSLGIVVKTNAWKWMKFLKNFLKSSFQNSVEIALRFNYFGSSCAVLQKPLNKPFSSLPIFNERSSRFLCNKCQVGQQVSLSLSMLRSCQSMCALFLKNSVPLKLTENLNRHSPQPHVPAHEASLAWRKWSHKWRVENELIIHKHSRGGNFFTPAI